MDLRELICEFRTATGDHGVPPLWEDKTVARWLSEAEREAAIRAKLLRDNTTALFSAVTLIPGQSVYTLHPKVFEIDPRGASMSRPNDNPAYADRRFDMTLATLDDQAFIETHTDRTGWASRYYLYDEPAGDGVRGIRLVIDRAPREAGGTLHLSVYRLPQYDLESPSDEPEIAELHHLGLVNWALFRAYSVRDIEGSASTRAADHLSLFASQFGQRPDANVMRKQRRHRAVRCRPEVW